MTPLAHCTNGTRRHIGDYQVVVEPCAAGGDLTTRGDLQEAVMTHWHDSMVDRPDTDGAVYATGWTISGLAVLGAIVAVWILGI
jgi:hypothetical protein